MRKIKGLHIHDRTGDLRAPLGYLTRNTVAVAAPTLMEELSTSPPNSIPISSRPIPPLIPSCSLSPDTSLDI